MLAVVSDSSPIIYLTRLELLSLLHQVHELLIVPEAVWQEIVVGGRGLPEAGHLQQAVTEGWIRVRAPGASPGATSAGAASLGRGELEAILLAKELAAILLTDDADARQFAERQGVKVTGTLGVLIRAKAEGHLARVRPLLDRLRDESDFRMSEQLYGDALRESGELA